MRSTGNTMLVTGGGSGIGRALAHRWHDRGNTVIVAGRREATLAEAVSGRPGMSYVVMDVTDAGSVAAAAERVLAEHPSLNVLVNNAGASVLEDVTTARDLAEAETVVATNFLGTIRVTDALIDHLKETPGAAIINTSSGIAFVPAPPAPTYSASKAAVHSYTQSLRALLKGRVEVIEIVPPQVATDLLPSLKGSPQSVPLDSFADEVMALLDEGAASGEIVVESAVPFRSAEREGRTEELIEGMLPPRGERAEG